MRSQVHSCPHESIWFAISQPLCIMHMSNIYSYFMQISHVSCIWPSGCRCLFILSTRHNRGYIFCPRSFGYCKPRFIPNYVFMFWNRNWVFKLTTIDVPSGLQTRNSQSSVIITMNSALLVNLMCISAKLSLKSPTAPGKCTWGYLNFGR